MLTMRRVQEAVTAPLLPVESMTQQPFYPAKDWEKAVDQQRSRKASWAHSPGIQNL